MGLLGLFKQIVESLGRAESHTPQDSDRCQAIHELREQARGLEEAEKAAHPTRPEYQEPPTQD